MRQYIEYNINNFNNFYIIFPITRPYHNDDKNNDKKDTNSKIYKELLDIPLINDEDEHKDHKNYKFISKL